MVPKEDTMATDQNDIANPCSALACAIASEPVSHDPVE